MSQEKISDLEKKVAVMDQKIEALPSLINKMEKNTEAVTDLTHQIKMQVKMYGDIKLQVDDHADRIRTLEDDQYRDNLFHGIKSKLFWFILFGVIGGIGSGLWYYVTEMLEHMQKLH